ncbi:MAG TPA: DNA/RNA nuclease SfsA [Acetivibrio sp.]|uniref:DNA/RNA nuclease SfsA n=1 Tax=Acetivibrio sp. TaxID=1872092 RepID=UPI002D09A42B|nr:DNA/RNA nuclease SfsA [Acetivibrio sp.]HOM02343.1 DNA/RNA nuclease SfsA [Acetivibrio sp.]
MRIEGELVEAKFIKRLNRFVASVEVDGVQELAHVPNTGRLKELLEEGASVMVRKYDGMERKTRFGLILVRKNGIWVSIDSANAPNRIMHEALIQGKFEKFRGYGEIRREVTLLNSRFDFGLFSEGNEFYIEVKGVTLVENRQGFFPDAPTKRGTRHLEELAKISLSGKKAGVVFIVQREDADVVRPNARTDKDFANALKAAAEAGVDLMAYVCKVDAEQRRMDIVREIPVVL